MNDVKKAVLSLTEQLFLHIENHSLGEWFSG